jgi:hypothetical protein
MARSTTTSKPVPQGNHKFRVTFKAQGKSSVRCLTVAAPDYKVAKKQIEDLPDCLFVLNIYQCVMELQFLPQEVISE